MRILLDNRKNLAIEVPQSGIFRELSQSSLVSLSSVSVDRFTAVSLLPDSAAGLVVSFNDGSPWLLRHELGKGSIWIATTSCDTADTNLPNRPVFVPLMQRLLHAACGSKPSLSIIDTGNPWVIPIVDSKSGLADDATIKLQVTTPRNEKLFTSELVWADTRQIGLYEVNSLGGASQQRAFCWVDSEPNSSGGNLESGRSDMTKENLKQTADLLGVNCYFSVDSFLAGHNESWNGREIGNWFWLAALACFVAEIAVAQSFSVYRLRSDKSNPASSDFQTTKPPNAGGAD